MKPSLILPFFLLASLFCSSQALDKKYVDGWLKMYDTAYNVAPDVLYVIGGVPYDGKDTTKLNAALRQIPIKSLLSVNRSKTFGLGEAIVVTTIGSQTRRRKKEMLKNAKLRFVDSYVSHSQHFLNDAKDPVLYIDFQPIHHTETKKSISELKIKDIKAIYFIDNPVPSTLWGQNAKNGLVIIWTNKSVHR
jgi:hypothetical protein